MIETMIRKSDEIMFGVTERKLKELRATYKKGMTIQLDYMDDPVRPVPSGTVGKVRCVDDAGTIHVAWENGQSLGLIPSEGDCFHIVDEEENSNNSFLLEYEKYKSEQKDLDDMEIEM